MGDIKAIAAAASGGRPTLEKRPVGTPSDPEKSISVKDRIRFKSYHRDDRSEFLDMLARAGLKSMTNTPDPFNKVTIASEAHEEYFYSDRFKNPLAAERAKLSVDGRVTGNFISQRSQVVAAVTDYCALADVFRMFSRKKFAKFVDVARTFAWLRQSLVREQYESGLARMQRSVANQRTAMVQLVEEVVKENMEILQRLGEAASPGAAAAPPGAEKEVFHSPRQVLKAWKLEEVDNPHNKTAAEQFFRRDNDIIRVRNFEAWKKVLKALREFVAEKIPTHGLALKEAIKEVGIRQQTPTELAVLQSLQKRLATLYHDAVHLAHTEQEGQVYLRSVGRVQLDDETNVLRVDQTAFWENLRLILL